MTGGEAIGVGSVGEGERPEREDSEERADFRESRVEATSSGSWMFSADFGVWIYYEHEFRSKVLLILIILLWRVLSQNPL